MLQRLAASAFPGSRTPELLEAIAPSFPIEVVPAESVLQIALSNMNMVVHCLTLLLNVGRVEATGGAFRFYTDGVTPTIGKLMEILDGERRQVGKAYGLELASAVEWEHTSEEGIWLDARRRDPESGNLLSVDVLIHQRKDKADVSSDQPENVILEILMIELKDPSGLDVTAGRQGADEE